MPVITALHLQHPAPTVDYPRPDRRLQGNPLRTTHSHYLSTDGELECGIWESEVGAWQIAFAEHKEEFFCVLHGRVRLTDESGHGVEVAAGEAAVIPPGFRGVFAVLQPVRKYFVVRETASAPT